MNLFKTVHLPADFPFPLKWGDEKDGLALPEHWPQALAGCARRVIIGYSVDGGETFKPVTRRTDLAGRDFRRAVRRGKGVLLLKEPVGALVLHDADSTPRDHAEVKAQKEAVKEAHLRKYRARQDKRNHKQNLAASLEAIGNRDKQWVFYDADAASRQSA